MRLIDADAIEHCLVIGGRRHGKTIISEIVRRAIQTAPTVDAKPVRHGKWIRYRDLNGIKRCKCSECIVSYGNMDTPYCPNCGAIMDGGEE